VIETQPGKGCFLTLNHSPLKKEVRRRMLIQEIDQVIVQAHHLQVPSGEFLKLVHDRIEALDSKRRSHEDDKED
jgi:DNA-binding transcriptional regulator YhcF (GntR family)